MATELTLLSRGFSYGVRVSEVAICKLDSILGKCLDRLLFYACLTAEALSGDESSVCTE